jgi:predicted ATPase
MFKKISIENFKAFGKKQSLELAPITLIYGKNSGGKSSIIQSLLLIKQSIESKINNGIQEKYLIPKGLHADLGQSKSMHYKHLFSNRISISVAFDFDQKKTFFKDSLLGYEDVELSMQFEQPTHSAKYKLPQLTSINYNFNDPSKDNKKLNFTLVKGSPKKINLDDDNFFTEIDLGRRSNFFNFKTAKDASILMERASSHDASLFQYIDTSDINNAQKNKFQISYRARVGGEFSYLPTTVRDMSKTTKNEQVGFRVSNILERPSRVLSMTASIFDHKFEKLSYLGPMRSRPKRIYELSQQYKESIGSSGEYIVEAISAGDNTDEPDREKITSVVNYWMKTLEIPYSIEVVDFGDEIFGDLAQLKIIDEKNKISVAATDVGFGISQMLPILVEGVMSSHFSTSSFDAKTICVEQPEIHLHPKLQANFADFFISTAADGKCQWIIETHSEALILRIQRRIREKKLLAKDVAVVFVHPDNDEGSLIFNLRLSETGDFIDEWPGGFFEERFDEMFS